MNNQLALVKNETGLTPSQKAFVQASQGKQLHTSKRSVIEDELSDLIGITYFEAGVKPLEATTELFALVDATIKDLMLNFRFMTMEEIKKAFHFGVRKHYGDYFGLNVVTFHNWVKSYQSDQKRAEAMKLNALNAHTAEKKKLTDEEIEKINIEAVLRCWNDYKVRKVFNENNGYHLISTFEYLFERKIANFTHEQKVEFGKQAKVALNKQLLNKKSTVTNQPMSLKDIQKDFELIKVPGNIMVKNESQRIALKYFFDELIEMETDLEELLSNKEK